MRTTIRIDEALYRRLKAKAAQTGRTVSDLIEEAVRAALRPSTKRESQDLPALPTYGGGGVLPGVDLASNVAVREAMDEGVAPDALR